MCRNIKTLYNFEPPASEAEIHAAALQYVRKVSGFHEPSRANEAAFNKAVEEIAHSTGHLLSLLQTASTPRNREEVAAQAHTRALQRFGKGPLS